MLSNICVSIAERKYSDIINTLRNFSFAEIRLDLTDMSEDEIRSVFSDPNKRLIATCRQGDYDTNERIRRLAIAIEAGVTYVDVELDVNDFHRASLLEKAKKHGSKVIISHHIFDITPDILVLDNIISTCERLGADVVKLVTTANSPIDCANILSLYTKHTNIIAFAMGDAGKITRLAALYLGAPFTYASISDLKAVASGQINFNTMQQLIELL